MRPSFPLSLNSFITSVYYNASLPSCIPPVLHLSILRDPSFRASFCHESAFPASHLSCILPSLHPTCPASYLSCIHLSCGINPFLLPSVMNLLFLHLTYPASYLACILPVLQPSILRNQSFLASFCHESAFPTSHLSPVSSVRSRKQTPR